jgi:hypothetical protein
MSYIVDAVNPRDLFDKEGNFLGINSEHWINDALNKVGWDVEGRIDENQNILNKNKFELIKQKKRVLYSASGKELFLESIKNLMQSTKVSKEEFIIMMSIAMKRGNSIKFVNPLGLLYGIKYLSLYFTSKNQSEFKNNIKELISDAEEEGIASFDVIRYHRFATLYTTYNPYIQKSQIKPEKVPYKVIMLKEEKI